VVEARFADGVTEVVTREDALKEVARLISAAPA
jgi:hypothetical protein